MVAGMTVRAVNHLRLLTKNRHVEFVPHLGSLYPEAGLVTDYVQNQNEKIIWNMLRCRDTG